MDRRTFMVSAGVAMCAAPLAYALTADAARAHVREAVDAVLALVKTDASTPEKARRLRAIFDEFAAMEQIARFSAGLAWREMSDAQQSAYTDAFAHYLSVVYARRFQDYSGQTVTIGSVTDGGRRGMLVSTTVTQAQGKPATVEWLISDRPGRVVIADIIIEGVSMLVTQREEIGAMLEARGGSIDRLITDLKATSPG